MPNTLGHFALQVPAVRAVWPGVDPRWVLLGCVLPDVPWIVQRALLAIAVVDPLDLRLYCSALASLAATLLLCCGCAAWARRPLAVAVVLAVSALLHLLLDATQIKWGNGVFLFAPFSWQPVAFGWYGPESPVTYAMTMAGAGVAGWMLSRRGPCGETCAVSRRRGLITAACLAAYAVFPLAFIDALEATGWSGVAVLRDSADRVGREISIDRGLFTATPNGDRLTLWNGEALRLVGVPYAAPAQLSLRGRFVAADTIRVTAHHRHSGVRRSVPSYVGLALLAVAWIVPARRGATQRSPNPNSTRP